MTFFSLVQLAAAIIFAALSFVVIRRNPKATVNRFCGILQGTFVLWASGNIIHHLHPLVSYPAAHLAHRVGMMGVYTYSSAWLLFTLALTGRQKLLRTWLIYAPIVGIPLVLILHEWLGAGVGPVVNNGIYWGLRWDMKSPWTMLHLNNQAAGMLLGFYLVARFGRRATQKRQRTQAVIIICSLLAPWIIGSSVDIAWAGLTGHPVTEMVIVFGLIWAAGLAISVTRYGLTSYTVQAAADKILATVPDVLLLLDTEGNVLTANEATANVLGYGRNELVGQSASRLFDKPGDFQPLLFRVEHEQHLAGLETVVRSRDGRMVPVSITARTMPQSDGTVHGSIWVLHDITAIRQAEEMQAQMTREIAATNAELAAANKVTAAANKELNDFAHVVSHDLKAPLRGVSSLAQWLGESYYDKLDADGREQLDLLRGRVKRMDNLIEGILQYSRAGRVREKQVEVNLSEMLPEVIDLLSPPAHIKVQIETPLPTVSAERTRIEQVFQNLLSNAVKYNDKPEGLIRIGSIDDGEHWRFYVADNGPGIEEKDFERIFQVFQTGKPRDQVESTGVGLAVVKRSVEMYGGRVWVESKVGEGSTFSFTYPKQVPGSSQQP